MIVHKIWNTRKDTKNWNAFTFKGVYYSSSRERNWEGWFLFGIIPLYIKNVSNSYFDR